MEHQQGNTQGTGSEANSNQIPYPVNPYQPGPGPVPVPDQSPNQTTNHPPAFSAQMAQQHQLAYQYNQQQQQQQLHQQLQDMWAKQYQEIEQATDFKNHSLPLARIKKIMKSDEDVRMISAEVPVIFARACEMFIQELTTRAWSHTEENKRRTLQKSDIASAVARTDIFDFLVDVVPPEDLRDEALPLLPRGGGGLPGVGDGLGLPPYYYMPPPPLLNQPPVGAPGMFAGGYGQAWPQQLPPPPAEEEEEDDS